jgi:hypothetical protein
MQDAAKKCDFLKINLAQTKVVASSDDTLLTKLSTFQIILYTFFTL